MNTLLNDEWRKSLEIEIGILTEACPEMIARKYSRANVQQAFVYSKVKEFATEHSRILSVGSFEDTAYETLHKEGYDIVGIDPVVNMGLAEFFRQNYGVNFYDVLFSTSVIEHVEDDEKFIDQICKLLKPEGYGVLTCDFRDDWQKGDPKPVEDVRLYTEYDLVERLRLVLERNNCNLVGDVNYYGEPDFTYGIYQYSFASYVFRKMRI